MRAKSKVLATALAAALLVTGTVFGTMAYLTDSKTVTNTMTVGNIAIELDEAKTDTDGTPVTPETRVIENTYKLVPGHEYTKDPTVHVDKNSENSWLFVKIDNQIAGIEADTSTTDPVYAKIADQITANGWTALGTDYPNVYYREYAPAAAPTVDTDYVVFSSFKIKGEGVTGDTLKDYDGKEIVVNAYAVQKDGFDSAAAAWEATFGA